MTILTGLAGMGCGPNDPLAGGGSGGASGSGGVGTGTGSGGSGGTARPNTGGAPPRGGATAPTGGAQGTGGTGNAGGPGGSTGACVAPPIDPVIGWASLSGMGVTTTTGGGNATPTMVTTTQGFITAARGNTAAVIYVMGVLANANVSVGSNKTVVGLCGAELHGHVDVSGASNVIIRNIKIVGYGVGNCALDPNYDAAVGCSSGNDAMTIQNNSHHIWVDHADISDGTDGNLDITSGSDFVTVSWTKFHYTPRTDPVGNDSTGANGHRFSNLIGSADNVPGDVGHLNITWHHDWWADNVNQRMPRSRYGQIHMLNNLFTPTGDSYCTNAGLQTHLLVEGNAYINVSTPLQIVTGGDMLQRNNLFTMVRGSTTAAGTGFTPTYQYTVEDPATIMATVSAGAGPH